MDGATPFGDASVLLDAKLEPEPDGALPGDGAVVVPDGRPPQADGDGDGVSDRSDNCPTVANPTQGDSDGDSAGDVCDNCVPIANIDQADTNQNAIGDVCEAAVFRDGDQDGDGVANADDTCLFVSNPNNADVDGDGFGDACDNCPALANGDQADLNNDGTGDACADGRGAVVDSDGDGLQDANDNCPQVASSDTTDRDSDLIGDLCDNCPSVANYKQVDSDMDSVGDLCEPLFNDPTQDGDADGVANAADNCLQLANPDQRDQDGDRVGDACDNCVAVANADQRPVSDPAKCMYNPAQDTDADGVPDQDDNCPTLANVNQADQDMDRRGDACDNCVGRANYSQVDSDGDNVGDVCEQLPDRDADGAPDATDNCIGTANADQADGDGDNVGNACDNCPSTPNSGQQDSDNDRVGDHCDDNALPPANTCAEGTTQANPVKPNLYFLLDRSWSMVRNMDPMNNRLVWLKSALDTLFGSDAMPGSVVSNFNVGMGVFPGAGDAGTTQGSCSAADLPVSLLTMASYPASTLRAAYAGLSANGLTPTDVALARVRERELYNLANDPLPAARAKAVVLITDGEPNNCTISGTSAPTNRVGETVAQARKLAAAGVPVYVLGFTGVNDDVMAAIAFAGSRTLGASLPTVSCSERYCSAIGSGSGCSGAGSAPGCICDDDPEPGTDGYSPAGCDDYASLDGIWYPVSNAQSIVGALNEIITRTVSCTLPLTPTPGRTVDSSIARVRFVNGATTTLLTLDTDYTLSGTSVTLVGDACANLQSAVISNPDARVEVDLGCACVAGSAEICFDGLDNDCDGRVDEDCIPTDVCGVDAPVENCRTPEEDTPEVCDGVDNDKDGEVDEGCPMTCESPTAEYCDRVDNDCDGQTDEDCPPACVPAPEICNGADDDCNQLVDEGCDMTCRPFTEICNGVDDDCDAMVDEGCLECPARGDEICDGKDNDCDGLIDEGCPSGPLFL